MTDEDIAQRLQRVEDRSQSNTHRLDTLESLAAEIHQQNTTLAVMSTQMQASTAALEKLSARVAALEKVPASRWEKIIGSAITAIVAGIIGAVIATLH